jgi:signal transduction histidine kinase
VSAAAPEELVFTIVRLLPEAGLLVTGAGEIVFANRAAREALGIDEERPAALRLQDVVATHPDEVARYLRFCARSTDLLPGSLRVDRREYLSKGGRVTSHAAGEGALLFLRLWPKGEASPFVLLNQQIAQLGREVERRRAAEDALRRSEQALRERAVEAEQASRLKDEFLATLGHELRTPLNAVLGWATMLRDPALDPERRQRAAEVIERNARAQAQLIDELLDVSRIVSGKLRLNVQELDPMAVIEAALETIRPAADAKGIRLQPVLDPMAGPIAGDPDRLQQIVWNLLSNAVKFTPRGGRVQVLLERVASSVEITVSDSGQGIAPEFMPHLFERLRQQDHGTARQHGGLGLGLSIAKNLAELHGGTIRAHSDGPGRGATFVVRLPRTSVRTEESPRPFAAASLPPSAPPTSPSRIVGLRIVAVDDEPDALELLAMTLERHGAQVLGARSAREALDLVARERPDVLISDIGMPGEDGYSLIRRVRELAPEAGGRTVAIALTAFARPEDRTRALLAGFQTHVPKPVQGSELVAVIASLTGRFAPG